MDWKNFQGVRKYWEPYYILKQLSLDDEDRVVCYKPWRGELSMGPAWKEHACGLLRAATLATKEAWPETHRQGVPRSKVSDFQVFFLNVAGLAKVIA